MRLQLTGATVEAPDSVRQYVEAKFRKLERRLHEPTLIEVVLAVERNPKIATTRSSKRHLYARGRTCAAVRLPAASRRRPTQLVDKLERQVERARDKRHAGAPASCTARRAGATPPEPASEAEESSRALRAWLAARAAPRRLAREAGLTPEPEPHDPGPHWGEVGIHGVHRQRDWDALVAAAAGDPGDEVRFVALADGSVVDRGLARMSTPRRWQTRSSRSSPVPGGGRPAR